ncbi:hypothetical protein LTR49_025550 [Elasticomyces elasticus]|nr:hypothetical protein LTR49_025550 [Elasticomyces elasticus]
MSLGNRLAILEILLRVKVDESIKGSNGTSAFEEDMVALRSFSFVSHIASAQEWEMYRLVQDATLAWLEGHGRLNEIRQRFVHPLYTSFPMGHFQNWSQRPIDPKALLEWALVMYRSAWYIAEQGALIDAHEMATSSTTVNTRQLGPEDESTLASTAMVALTFRDQGQWQEAEELSVKVMETSRRLLGEEHPVTLSSVCVGDLASTYRSQREWKEVEELEVKVMAHRNDCGVSTSCSMKLHNQTFPFPTPMPTVAAAVAEHEGRRSDGSHTTFLEL